MIATAFSGVIEYFKIKWILKNEKRKCCFSIFEINLKLKKNYLFQFSNIKWNWNAQKCPFPFQFHNENRMALSVHGLMRVWEVSFHFQFKIEIKIDKNVNFDFCLNIEFWILTLKPNVRLQYLDWKANFEITYFYFSFFILKWILHG